MTEKFYCIYSNEYIEKGSTNREHIIPKKLGGQLDLAIDVCKKMNSDLGSKIDAKFIENTYIKLLCKNYCFVGHSKKTTPTFKNSIIQETQEVVDISLINNEMIFHKKHGKDSPAWTKSLKECKAKAINVRFDINLNDYMRFFAKILLSSGYYMYKDCFINNAWHEDLRKLMLSDNPSELIEKKEVKTRILADIENPDPFMNIVTIDNLFSNYHVIWSSFAQNAVMLGVSLFGNKMLSVNCQISDTPDKFPLHG